MTITAKVIADSISSEGIRLTTMELRYPRYIHSEFMTHRMFSRNASSSRAIPVERLIADVVDDPAVPIFWGKNQKGMQAKEELTGWSLERAQAEWLKARDQAVASAKQLALNGAHKQIVNRIIEPFTHIKVVVTATDWENFYTLRRHEDAEPTMQALAEAMWATQQASQPKLIHLRHWHVPYLPELGNVADPEQAQLAVRVSVARCARVSYRTHDGVVSELEEDLKLYDRLLRSDPLHASPAEHQATPDQKQVWHPPFAAVSGQWLQPQLWGNLFGWKQYRKTLLGECVRDR